MIQNLKESTPTAQEGDATMKMKMAINVTIALQVVYTVKWTLYYMRNVLGILTRIKK